MPVVDWQLLGPALVAGLLVVLTHVPLGQEVLRRGIIFLDLAIAQMAALGALVAVSAGFAPQSLVVQGCSFLAGLLSALFLQWSERRHGQDQEAIIGILFVLAATAALLVLAGNPHGGEAMQDILAGQILWVSYDQLLIGALVYAAVLPLLLSGLGSRPFVFYCLFSLCVTLSVQWVGVYLVFSTLIIPALATKGLAGWRRLGCAYAMGATGYFSGLWLSTRVDWPSGPLIVWCLLLAALAGVCLRRLVQQRHQAGRAGA